jgi:hypothetical protein
MNHQSEHELAGKIVRYLDYGVEHLDAATRERLAVARRNALARYREQPEPVYGLAWATAAAAQIVPGRLHGMRPLIAAAALILALVGIAYWQTYWQNGELASEIAEIDVKLLTDELPINAYLDKGFDSWLKRSSR